MINITSPYKEDMIIPFAIRTLKGSSVIDVYAEYLNIAKEYEKFFSDDLFSDTALCWLDSKLSPILKVKGYVRYDKYNEWYYVFYLNSIDQLKPPFVGEKIVDVSESEYEFDETEFQVDIIKEKGEPASLIIKEGRIASICAANFFDLDEDAVELAVETLPDFQGNGYGRAVLCDMSKKIFNLGKIPIYEVSRFNKPSIKTVLSAGFCEYGKEFYYNCYKEEI